MLDYLSQLWLKWRFSLLCLVLFVLPWQTAYIFLEKTGNNGSVFEFEKGVVYLVELFIFLLFISDSFLNKKSWLHYFSEKQWALVFLVIGFIFLASNPVLSAIWVFHLLSAFCLGYLLWQEKDRAEESIIFLAAGAVIPVLLGFFQFVHGSSFASSWFGLSLHEVSRLGEAVVLMGGNRVLRAYGTFSHPNVFGAYLAVCSFLLFVSYREDLSKKTKIAYLSLFSICLAGLMITFSKTAILALVTGLFCWFILKWSKRREIWQKKRWLIAVSFFVVSVCLSLTFSLWQGRINAQNPIEMRSYTERSSQAEEAFVLWKMHPWIGVGLGGYTEALQKIKPDLPAWEYQPAHNLFLLVLSELGAMGVLLVMFFLFILIRTKRFPKKIWPFFAVFLMMVLFDHYVWTSWSGKIIVMLLVVFGLSFFELDREPAISNNRDHAGTLK